MFIFTVLFTAWTTIAHWTTRGYLMDQTSTQQKETEHNKFLIYLGYYKFKYICNSLVSCKLSTSL